MITPALTPQPRKAPEGDITPPNVLPSLKPLPRRLETRPLRGGDCRCGSCGRDFSGIVGFDAHWIGKLPRRRCPSDAELGTRYTLTERGTWSLTPSPAEQARLGKLWTSKPGTTGNATVASKTNHPVKLANWTRRPASALHNLTPPAQPAERKTQ